MIGDCESMEERSSDGMTAMSSPPMTVILTATMWMVATEKGAKAPKMGKLYYSWQLALSSVMSWVELMVGGWGFLSSLVEEVGKLVWSQAAMKVALMAALWDMLIVGMGVDSLDN